VAFLATKSITAPGERALSTGRTVNKRRRINTDMVIAFFVLLPSIIAVAVFI